MRYYLVCCLLLIASCGQAPNQDTTPPATPSNLSALASPGQVNLAWQANIENDLARYNLYQGTQIGNLGKIAEVLAGTETFTVSGLNNGTTYFFAIDAQDQSGNRSLRSTEVSATPNLLQQVCVFDNAASSFDNCVFN